MPEPSGEPRLTGLDRSIEWPTLGVFLLTYGGFAVSTVFLPHLSVGLAVILLGIAIALHSSLQHEILHGHPFRRQWLCDLLVFPAVGLFVPYLRFRDTHLAHHRDSNLTDPYDDPESNYMDPEVWHRMPGVLRTMLRFNNTLLGRLTLGPALGLACFYGKDLAAMARGDRAVWKAYAVHCLGLLPVIYWIANISTLPVWAYLAAAYLALSLLKIRTFLEHRAHEATLGRTVVIEDNGPLAFLFLNNNLHVVHHAHPKTPWYELPSVYRANRASFLRRNRDYHFRSYWEIFRRYLVRAKDPVPHPFGVASPSKRGRR